MSDWLGEPLTTVAFCWRLERTDGIAIGLTTHDRDLSIDGMRYRTAPGMTPSAIQSADGLEGEGMTVAAALGHAAIAERDLRAGRWDGARAVLFAVDWTRTGAVRVLSEGRIGTVFSDGTGFVAELEGVERALERPVSEETSPTCRATLGDHRCRVPMAGRRRIARVAAADDARLRLEPAGPAAGTGGTLRWLTGPNSGLHETIVTADDGGCVLSSAPRFATVGAMVEVTEGCDGRLSTCRDRFDNVANFRGEPHLPGVDLLTRYPGA